MKVIRQYLSKGAYRNMYFPSSSSEVCSLGYSLVDDHFLEKHVYIIFQKQWVRDVPDHYRSA